MDGTGRGGSEAGGEKPRVRLIGGICCSYDETAGVSWVFTVFRPRLGYFEWVCDCGMWNKA